MGEVCERCDRRVKGKISPALWKGKVVEKGVREVKKTKYLLIDEPVGICVVLWLQ